MSKSRKAVILLVLGLILTGEPSRQATYEHRSVVPPNARRSFGHQVIESSPARVDQRTEANSRRASTRPSASRASTAHAPDEPARRVLAL